MRIKGVLFDLGGVLFTLGEAEYRREMARRLGLGDAMPPGYEERLAEVQRGELDEQDLWEALSGRRPALNAFDDAWLGHFHPVPAMFELARELRGRGVRTAVLSNTQHSHVAIMRRTELLAEFDPVVMSCEAGRRKPEPAVFAHVIERLGLLPKEVLFIDDVSEYVQAAQRVGLQGLVHSGDPAATRLAVLERI